MTAGPGEVSAHQAVLSLADPRAALAQLEQSIERAKRAESRSIRVGRVALELLEARFRDAP